MIEAVVLSNDHLETLHEWQRAIALTGYGLELNTAIPIESLDGYVPVKWRKSIADRNMQKTGFECRYLSKDVALKDIGCQQTHETENFSTKAFALGWCDDPVSKITVRIAAAAYATATRGALIIRNVGPVSPKSLLSEVDADDKYGYLPRLESMSLFTAKIAGYRFDERPSTVIRNSASAKLHELKRAEYAVLVGRNNSGKSFVLKCLTEHWGKRAAYLGPIRYQNFNLLTHFTPTENKQDEKWRRFTNDWANDNLNIDNSPLNLQQSIAELTNDQRANLRCIVKELLGVELDFCFTVPNSDMSQKYVSCNGHNLSFTSSGIRLIIAIITSLLDESYETVLVDEPELGISPEAQGVLADFFFNQEYRQRYFSHIKTLILATHSSIFLDRRNIRNNYVVEKSGDAITIQKIEQQKDFNRIHFFLLGNRFETLYLPSSILLVEGKTDLIFIERVLSVRYPNARVSAIATNADGEIKRYLNMLRNLLGGIQRSPYQDRLFVVLDSRNSSAGLPADIAAMGLPNENIIRWSKNGIEHVYPNEIVSKIFGEGPEIEIDHDHVSRNGITLTKAELAKRISDLVQSDTKMNSEFEQKLLAKLDALLL